MFSSNKNIYRKLRQHLVYMPGISSYKHRLETQWHAKMRRIHYKLYLACMYTHIQLDFHCSKISRKICYHIRRMMVGGLHSRDMSFDRDIHNHLCIIDQCIYINNSFINTCILTKRLLHAYMHTCIPGDNKNISIKP